MSDYASEGGHWYLPDGTPFYTYKNKQGEEKNVTLRQARPVNAGPSVSMIGGLAPAPQLVNWKLNQVIQLSAENPREPEEGMQAYMDRIQAMFRERGETIMGLGSAIHGEIEKALVDTVWIPRPEAHAAIQALGAWCGLDSLRPEKSFYHSLGFGGKVDVHKPGFVADFKTKDFTESWNPATWDNHAMQLAAYREGFGMPEARCAIIFISTAVPGLTHTVEIEEKKLQQGWELFKCLLSYWQNKNRYWPIGKELENV